MDDDEIELFETSLRAAVEAASGADLDAALADIGWRDALEVEPQVSTAALFGAQGRHGSTSGALGWAMADALGLGDVTLVLPAAGSATAPGRVEGGTLTATGLLLASSQRRHDVVVVADDGERHRAVTVGADALDRRKVAGMDPRLGLVQISATAAVPADAATVDWNAAVTAGQLAISHELVGVSRAMLDLARDHALERIQFGGPIARFQAVRHRLADTLLAIEAADAAIGGAWQEGTAFGASIAKAVAGRSARAAARHCQQVLAGIGFTDEHPLHHFIRRALVLDSLLGSSDALTKALGAELATTRRLPSMLPL